MRGEVRERADGRSLASTLLSIPLHLSGVPFLKHGLRRMKIDTRARNAWRDLDRIELEQFQKRARTYVQAAAESGAGRSVSINGHDSETRQFASTVIYKEECP